MPKVHHNPFALLMVHMWAEQLEYVSVFLVLEELYLWEMEGWTNLFLSL